MCNVISQSVISESGGAPYAIYTKEFVVEHTTVLSKDHPYLAS